MATANKTTNIEYTAKAKEMAADMQTRAKAAYEKALADMNEISEIVTKTNSEALEVINQRVNASFSEVQKILSENKS